MPSYRLRFKGCAHNSTEYRNQTNNYVINLDQPPKQRWIALVMDYKKEISDLIENIKKNVDDLFGAKLIQLVEVYMPYLAKTLPKIYYEEMVGISEAIDTQLGEVVLYNLFYEFFSVCTSVIVESPSGSIYHGRNLDFGLFMGWSVKNKTWVTSNFLRKMVVTLDFQKNGTTIYKSVNFAGYIGILTGMKPNIFSFSVNERFRLNGGFVGITEWIIGFRHQNWLAVLTREVMEQAKTYTSAQKMLSNPKLVAPVYFILAGTKSSQGCIITRGRGSFDLWRIGEKRYRQNGTWYQVQTNYDHWKNPPFYDDRQFPAEFCIEELGQDDPVKTLQGVLSTRPVLNKLTIYSAVMQASSGKLDMWLQDCNDPCWPW
ncbi:hypothetical protein J437_LFUL004767 [Ladona fulva]|uniref:Acid ceramidase n=1 Tax=Ladona fulva TaxID=123851 RepID=A0A8K0K4H1_LADFU|nr:hypothetical protein J437_LFUL004767 [Ladona fulva]